MRLFEYQSELAFLGVEVALSGSQVDVSEKPSDVDHVHSGIEEVGRRTGPHGRERQGLMTTMDERLPHGPHEALSRERRAALVSDEDERVLLVVISGRAYDFLFSIT